MYADLPGIRNRQSWGIKSPQGNRPVEQPLPPYGSCNLGSINLGNFVKRPYTDKAEIDWKRLAEVVHVAVRFLDNVIDANKYPIPQIADKARRDRRIGLGVMGWAEMLVMLGIPYDSEEAIALASKVMSFIKQEAVKASSQLAEERGTYPEWPGSAWDKAGVKVRNATLTTVAPTGTISLIAAKPHQPVSGGIEPKFALVFVRRQADSEMLDVDGQFELVAKKEGWYSEEIMREVARRGTCTGVPGVPEKWQKVFRVANEISHYWHVRMQAAFQGDDSTDVLSQPVDAAVSKTINFPNSATVEDVRQAYELAWRLGCKGITVYRDGSRASQVLTAGTSEKKAEQKTEQKAEAQTNPTRLPGPALRPRPMEAVGKMFVVPTHFGKVTVDVHMDENGEPFEIICNVGAAGSDTMADAVAIGMMTSRLLRLRSDVPVRERIEIAIETMRNISGSGSYGFGPNRVRSLPSAIALALQKFLNWYDKQQAAKASEGSDASEQQAPEAAAAPSEPITPPPGSYADPCPSCGNYTFFNMEGCRKCISCGHSEC